MMVWHYAVHTDKLIKRSISQPNFFLYNSHPNGCGVVHHGFDLSFSKDLFFMCMFFGEMFIDVFCSSFNQFLFVE